MQKYAKVLFMVLAILVVIFLVAINLSFEQKHITWGVDFSQMQAVALKLDWKETYLAMIDDLGVKYIKLHTQWDFIEGIKGQYYFNDIDWQLQQAQAHDVKIIYVVGLKTGRWPECHAPGWASSLPENQEQQALLQYIQQVVQRYKSSPAIEYWQVENEPLLQFGQCPTWYYQNDDFLKQEVALVKSLDPARQVVISDSGELSLWQHAAQIGDMVGTTMYRKAWVNVSSYGFFNIPGFYGSYPIPPIYYFLKTQMIKYLYNKKVICVELQAEPWGPKLIYDLPLSEQVKTMNPQQFQANIQYAKATGFDTYYLWGVEWWYWMKTKQNQPQIWDEARELFKQ